MLYRVVRLNFRCQSNWTSLYFGDSHLLVLEDPGEDWLLRHEDELARVVLDEEDGDVAGLGALAVHWVAIQ